MRQTRVNSFRRVYRVSRWIKRRFTPTGQLVLLAIVVSGAIGIDTSRNLSYQIFCLLSAMVLLAMVFSAFKRPRFTCERHLPPIATAGEPLHYYLSITPLSGKNATDLFVIDQPQDHFPSEQDLRQYRDHAAQTENRFDQVVGFPRWVRLLHILSGALPATLQLTTAAVNQKTTVPLTITPLRRGYLRFSQILIGNADPSGLFRKFYRNTGNARVLVLPKRYAVPKIPLPGHRHHHQGGIALASSVGEAYEFHGLRDYQPGDPLRHIHWRSWARSGKPVVKKYADEFFVRHALLLDTYAQHATAQQFEEAVSVAASLAMRIGDQESLLDLMFVNQQAFRFTCGRHTNDLHSMLEILAGVQAEYQLPFDTLIQLVKQHTARLSAAVCVFLTWDKQRAALVDLLTASGISTLVFIVSDSHPQRRGADTAEPAAATAPLHYLQAGNIEADLAKLACTKAVGE